MGPIGVFDSGVGGLTILSELIIKLPKYDFMYLGDNARAPYGNRSFESIYHYTLQCVSYLFNQGCELIILACNTASARALRTIQQNDLHKWGKNKRVLGIIRPTAEVIGHFSQNGHIGIVGTSGTIISQSYIIEIQKFFPQLSVVQEACPIWVPLVENEELNNEGSDFFVKKHIHQLLYKDPKIDTLLLGCTHYPFLLNTIKKYLPSNVNIVSQGDIVANSLLDYLYRHPEMDELCTKNSQLTFFTTDDSAFFDQKAILFFPSSISSITISVV